MSKRAATDSSLQRLHRREPVFGIMQTLPSPALTELAVWSGMDFVILDCEHGIVDEGAHVASLQVLSNSGAFSAVRVMHKDFGAIGRYLDFGADALLFPDIQSAADAREFVAAATYGPQGTRSSTRSVRGSRYGLKQTHAPTPPLLLGMIEGRRALGELAAIAATPGIGGLIIGPNDLSADLSCPGQFAAPEYAAAIAQVEAIAVGSKLLLGTITHPNYPVERLVAAGHRLIIVSSDVALVRDGCQSQLAAVRAALAKNSSA